MVYRGRVFNAIPALERLGYGRAYFLEASLAVFSVVGAATQHVTRIEMGTDVAIAFARTPMGVAYSAATLQFVQRGTVRPWSRFLGLRPHRPPIRDALDRRPPSGCVRSS